MRVLKFIAVLVLLVACAVGTMMWMGSRLPHEHVAKVTANISAKPARVWAVMEDVSHQPSWRTGLKSVEPMPDQDGHKCWVEVQAQMRMPLCELETIPESRRVVQIADPKLPFGGTWTYELSAADAYGSRLTITENGTTGPAIWRFLGHYLFHEDASIRQYEADLQKAAMR